MAITITHKDEADETSEAMFGEHDHLEYSNQVTFPALVFESLTGKAPTEQELKLFNLILNLSFDHGPNSPSATATIAATKEGKPMGQAVGAGVAELNEKHGGAGEPLMVELYRIKNGELSSKEVVGEYLSQGKRMPGFGHRVYKDKDPRAQLILETAEKEGVGLEFMEILGQLHQELNSQSGKILPVNVDGAIAAVLCGLGLEPKLGIPVLIVAETP